ncbi:MAG: NADH-quinone oxidoreductase subunit A [Kiritimatiellaeota bacterium]|nr:NADH-quinone oxidoreductase subunit A [Kiritimatiellota bacterium]
MTAQTAETWPLALYGLVVVGMTVAIIVISAVIGQRHRGRATGIPFESGMPPTGSAQPRFVAEFYLIAMFSVIFDLEFIFIVAWAVAARELGWAGYAEALVFMGLLAAALAYLWRVGALNWGTSGRAQGGAFRGKAGAP